MFPFVNPYPNGLKQVLYKLLGDNKYVSHTKAVDQICDPLISEEKYKELGALLVAVYEAGFLRAIEEHQTILNQKGLKATIVKQKQNIPVAPIFPQEKSG
jgi:hypothetical protein